MPGRTRSNKEERTGMLLIIVWEHDLENILRGNSGESSVLFPNDTEEQRTSRVHDSKVRNEVVDVVSLQAVNGLLEERMLRSGSHNVIGDTRR
ncbi:hypothetical protein WICPIJ_008970 [Wickerhamomyces pijperi]|uniref:Uncharacterized protein n=1 Tax=Wickerhamomyces pijperi TaxID=599730 RepID=A0A9P8PSF5_WICPI|nr:hypothetical protein WICPIJ_008970 [Wickerhamomyces pijperi]